MPEFTGTRDVRSYARMLWRWKFLFLFVLIAVPLATYLLERGKPTVYTAKSLVGVSQATVSTGSLNGGGTFSTTNVTAIAQIVTTSPVAAVAADLLHPPANASQIVGEVSATGDATTDFLTISATDQSAARAAAIANAFAHAISQNLQQAAIAQINSSIVSVEKQLAHLKTNDPGRTPLLEQLNQLRASEATQGSEAAILQPAVAPSAPSGPHLRRTVELALVLGLLLAFAAVLLAESSDRRLRTPEDLEGMTELPLLASIAPSAFSGDLDTTREDDEAFQMLRTALMYFNVDKLDSVMITSSGEKEGKTTVATRLAVVTANAGMNVILVDADLRRGQASSRTGLRAHEGLGAVLSGNASLEERLVDLELTPGSGGRLRVLPAGSPPPNPAALISSQQMLQVLAELESASDLVVIDTPAALAVSDPLALVPSVSGVVLVARMNRSTRQTVRRLQRMITSAHGELLGVVATGVTAGEGYYEHYSTKYYGSSANGNGNGKTDAKGLARLRRNQKSDALKTVVVPGEDDAPTAHE